MRRALCVTLCFGCLLAIAPAQRLAKPDAAREAALALEQQGKLVEAEAAWSALLKARPRNPEPYAHLGLLAARQQRYSEAIPYYRKALAINPAIPGLRLNLGLALFKAGDLAAAAPEFETLLKAAPAVAPEAQRLAILAGMSYYGLARYRQAAPFLEQAAGRDPENLVLQLALAHCYLWSKQSQKVLDVYHRILAVNPDSAEADMLAGEALDAMKDNAGSTRMFRDAVKADPKLPNVHFGLGYLLWTQKQYHEAASEFQAELANDPTHEQSLLYLGDTLIQLNRSAEAEPVLRQAIALSPSFGLAHLDLGIIALDAGRNDEAFAELTAAARLMPDDINVHWRLGRLYRTLGRKDEARAEFDKASSLNKAADEDLYKKLDLGRAQPSAAATASDPLVQPQP